MESPEGLGTRRGTTTDVHSRRALGLAVVEVGQRQVRSIEVAVAGGVVDLKVGVGTAAPVVFGQAETVDGGDVPAAGALAFADARSAGRRIAVGVGDHTLHRVAVAGAVVASSHQPRRSRGVAAPTTIHLRKPAQRAERASRTVEVGMAARSAAGRGGGVRGRALAGPEAGTLRRCCRGRLSNRARETRVLNPDRQSRVVVVIEAQGFA